MISPTKNGSIIPPKKLSLIISIQPETDLSWIFLNSFGKMECTYSSFLFLRDGILGFHLRTGLF